MTLIQPRRGTSAEWTAANPVLAQGEMGLETNTGKIKFGNGISVWAALPYWVAPAGALTATAYVATENAYQMDTERRDELTSGEATMLRRSVSSAAIPTTAGSLRLTYFTARKTETITQVRTFSGGTAAVGASLARVGVYLVAGNGDLTLITATVSDTTLWIATGTTYTRTLVPVGDPFVKTRGVRYAFGLLTVGNSTAPTMMGQGVLNSDECAQPPRLCGLLSGQTNLPTSITAGSISATNVQHYAALVP